MKKSDPHDEAMEILKDQMANPPQRVCPYLTPHTYARRHTQIDLICDLFDLSESKETSNVPT